MTETLYEADFVTWTERQADELRRFGHDRSNHPLDWQNLAEEIEDLGRGVRSKVESLVDQIIGHLLKLACSQAEDPRAGWLAETDQFRVQLARLLRDNHSLRARLPEIVESEMATSFRLAERSFRHHSEADAMERLAAWRERGITADEVVTDGLYPERASLTMMRDRS